MGMMSPGTGVGMVSSSSTTTRFGEGASFLRLRLAILVTQTFWEQISELHGSALLSMQDLVGLGIDLRRCGRRHTASIYRLACTGFCVRGMPAILNRIAAAAGQREISFWQRVPALAG